MRLAQRRRRVPVLHVGLGIAVGPPDGSDEIIVGQSGFHDGAANMACGAEDLRVPLASILL